MLPRLISSVVLGLAIVLAPQVGAAQEMTRIDAAWSRYLNARFGTSIDVPNVFTLTNPPPVNGDGRTFRAPDGAELRVFGSYSATTVTENFSRYKAWLLNQLQSDGVTLTYKAQGRDWLTVSGTKGHDIIYVKAVEGCGATHEMWLTYSGEHKKAYDSLLGRLARSLKCTPQQSG